MQHDAHDTPESVAALTEELRIVRSDTANAMERAQRAEARNVILRGKDTYDLPAVLERARGLQAEVDELRYERDPRNASIVTKRVRAKAAAANKAREAAEARATQAEAALAASEKDRQRMREALEKARPIVDAFRASGVDLLASDYDICRLVCPHITVVQMEAFCAALTTQLDTTAAALPGAQDNRGGARQHSPCGGTGL
ncbi:hypothetical protein [Azospirillum agricola]|uniref:hypothetical protein n=1 Tax=Azospirillum agricola TaxID=1720247 RepID=UPI000A0F2571|nr:hypothetical protein [Azospirillum agricola]SMH60473.1 hypothetical protein SAMN02982994_5514 [Azospirillum lipoferum]